MAKAKPFGQATNCGRAQWVRLPKRGKRCVRVCRNGQWKFEKNSVCEREARRGR